MQLRVGSLLRRGVLGILGACAMLLAVRGVARAHAGLLHSSPAANAVLASAPSVVRLVFDEPLDLSVSRLVLEGPDGQPLSVHLSLDPHDVHAMVGALPPLGTGAYRVIWSTVSADGHAVSGSYVFRIGASASAAPPALAPTAAAGTPPTSHVGPGIALRAAGDLSLSVTAGLLLFTVMFGAARIEPRRAKRMTVIAALLTPLFFAAHDVAWIGNAAPTSVGLGQWTSSMFGTGQGKVEAIRLGCALLVVWALLLMRRAGVALVFAAAALCCTGAVGHALAMHAAVAVPLKAAHALAMAAWLGGLCWILLREREPLTQLHAEVARISDVALAAVLVLVASGLGMALLFVPLTREALLHSAYATLLALKVLGLAMLACFGFVQRRRRVPRIASDAGASAALRRTVNMEIALMVAIFVLGAWLSYTSPHVS